MDVINLSLGEYEIEPGARTSWTRRSTPPPTPASFRSRPRATLEELGHGSVGSPASAAKANRRRRRRRRASRLAPWSSRGPTPRVAPAQAGRDARPASRSSPPCRTGGHVGSFSGTSMASPHVAGGAALLRAASPRLDGDAGQVGARAHGRPRARDAEAASRRRPTREGGGLDRSSGGERPARVRELRRRSRSASCGPGASKARHGRRRRRRRRRRLVERVRRARSRRPPGVTRQRPGDGQRPRAARRRARERRHRGARPTSRASSSSDRGRRRAACRSGSRVERPRLGGSGQHAARTPAATRATRAGRAARVAPTATRTIRRGVGISNDLPGPEQVFRVRVGQASPTSASRSSSQAKGRRRLAAHRARRRREPADGRARAPARHQPVPRLATVRPARCRLLSFRRAGSYDVVFDTRSRAVAGQFSFRLWIERQDPSPLALADTLGCSERKPRRVGHRRRLRGRSEVGRGIRRRQETDDALLVRAGARPAQRAVRKWPAHAGFPGVRLPGNEELREHGRAPAQHVRSPPLVRDPLGRRPAATQRCSCSSIVGRRSRSRCTLAANSSCSVGTTRRCDF